MVNVRFSFGLLGVVVLVCILSRLTYLRGYAWQSEKSLWQEATLVSPEVPRPHINLGLVFEREGRYDLALREFNTALHYAMIPNRMEKHQRLSAAAAESNISIIFLVRGDAQGAVKLATRAIRRAPDFRSAYVNRGTAFLALGRCAEAYADYTVAQVQELPRC